MKDERSPIIKEVEVYEEERINYHDKTKRT